MSKAKDFDEIIGEFTTLACNQHIIKDEAIQECGERTMGFVIENADLMARALRTLEALDKIDDPNEEKSRQELERLGFECRSHRETICSFIAHLRKVVK